MAWERTDLQAYINSNILKIKVLTKHKKHCAWAAGRGAVPASCFIQVRNLTHYRI